MMASMAAAYPDFPKPNQEPLLRKCTPFCDKNKDCPDHHELLVAIVNCTDMLGSLSNLDNLKECVDKYTKGGWGKDDDVPDAVMENRCPLIHWAASLGKCNALEWMLASGFSPVAKSSGNGETALHRAIQLLYKSRPKFTVKELNPKFSKMVGLLKEALLIKDEAHGDTPFHRAANMLVSGDHKPNFFLSCVEVIINKSKKMGDYSDAILNAVNNAGETVLHILARGEKHKVEYCTQAIRSLIVAGADRSIRNNEGQTALDIALAGGTESIVEELIRSQLMLMVKNTTKPLEALKTLLFELFTPDEVRLSSLKGRTTVAGGESVGLQREKLNMIYYVMEQRYKMERNAVDNLIRNQQRKLREQFKKLNNS